MADHGPPEAQAQPAPPGPIRSRRPARLAVVAALAAAGAAAYYYWPAPTPRPPAEPDITAADPLDEDDPPSPANPGYIGAAACAPCHAARAAEFSTTAHARACRRPTDGPMPSGFEPGKGNYATADPGLRFEMTRSGSDFFQTAVQSTPAGERRAKHHIDLVYGANHQADEVFFSWDGDRLNELVAAWLHPTNRWANTPYDRRGDGTFARAATPRCLECHNTWMGHVPGTVNRYDPATVVLGATCERCHGPGKDHAEYHRAHPGETAGRAVVHPGRLPRERLIEVCTQCHSNTPKPRGPAFTYRPGAPAETCYRTSTSRYPEDDHVANQVKYLRQSKCFQKSEMTCVTCHDPHKPHEAKTAAATRAACLTCHKPENCTDRPNLPAAVRDDCASCHMPPRVWMNVHFHTSDDRYVPPIRRFEHRIAVHPVARRDVLLAWHRSQPGDDHRREADRLTAELATYWLGEAESRHRAYRFLAAIGAAREALRLDPSQPLRDKAQAALRAAIDAQARIDSDWIDARHDANEGRLPQAIAGMEHILKTKPDFAVVHAKLGTLYAMTGRRDVAVEHLEAVARHDPDNSSGLAMLAWLAYLDGRAAESEALYAKANEIDPYDAKLTYHWGLALLRLGRWADAADRFRRVTAIDPRHAGGYQGLSHALRELGQPTDALRAARRAARLTEFGNPDVLVTLAEAYSAAGRTAEATAAAGKALAAAPPEGFDRDTRRRLDSLRAEPKP